MCRWSSVALEHIAGGIDRHSPIPPSLGGMGLRLRPVSSSPGAATGLRDDWPARGTRTLTRSGHSDKPEAGGPPVGKHR